MGEARKRSRNRKEILEAATRCVYCDNPAPTQIEHMPPRGLFKDKDRPAGWEFACCERCNQGSRGADAVAQMFSLLDTSGRPGWKVPQFRRLLDAAHRYAPRVPYELFVAPRINRRSWDTRNGLMRPVTLPLVNSPATVAHLNVFAAKMAMAAFADIMGRPVEMNGVLFTYWTLNSGFSGGVLDKMFSLLPMHDQLQQGRKTSGAQFQLRYNSDDKSLVGGMVSLHGNLTIILVATDGPDYVAWFAEHFQELAGSNHPGAQLARPGLPGLEALSGPSL